VEAEQLGAVTPPAEVVYPDGGVFGEGVQQDVDRRVESSVGQPASRSIRMVESSTARWQSKS
jgi:hypothetical protein